MTDQEAIDRAARAKALLEDPLMVEARAHIESECWRLFKELAPTAVDQLQQVKAMQYMHDKYRAYLDSTIGSGKLAQLNLDYAQKRPPGY